LIQKLLIAPVILCLISISAAWANGAATPQQQIAAAQTEMNETINHVARIVNQPVTHLRLEDGPGIGHFSPGWFHEGAIKPDFNTVDVRKTQEFPYERFTYVTSDLNPGEMFPANDLEFNSMTKFFYSDRSVPKKRLTEAEMLEINQLYRIIGRDEAIIGLLKYPHPDSARLLMIVIVLAPTVLFLMWPRKKKKA
jgi:hypothetical protein